MSPDGQGQLVRYVRGRCCGYIGGGGGVGDGGFEGLGDPTRVVTLCGFEPADTATTALAAASPGIRPMAYLDDFSLAL